MAETYKKLLDGTLEISKIQDTIISIITRDEIVAEIVRIQSEIDHFNISVVSAQKRKTAWEDKLVVIDKEL